ncbi:MAG: CRISPR-associated protein Cas5 [Nitrososphaerota archaeon]|uniref:CRISPR-associated protein Cas5 n=1 Tax=Saccharolobus sp. TaxID=2100761 RepID=UPI0031809ED6
MNKIYGFFFDISGDYAHFRHIFTQSFFDTLLAPPKTTISGILAAALGYDDEIEVIDLNERVLVGVKIIKMSGFAQEIINIKNLKEKTIQFTPVYRNLIVKPIYRIYLGLEDKELIHMTREALKSPKHPLYLGISEALATIENISPIDSIKEDSTLTIESITPVIDEGNLPSHKVDKRNFIVPARRYHTVKSFKLTKRGRLPHEYIDLIMFYGGYLEFKKPIDVFQIQDERVALF